MNRSTVYQFTAVFFVLPGLAMLNTLDAQPPAEGPVPVQITRMDGRFQLLRHGQPYPIKGAGGESRFAELAAAGGNSLRTWDADELGTILDQAHQNGLTVCAGLWMGHQRHGFSYQSQAAVIQQLEEKLAYVRKHRDHPALLMWGVGNEMEGEGSDPSVWYAVNHLAREIKRIDPHHPTMTVIAELGENAAKVRSIERFCPDIDIIGINSYGGIETLGERYREAGGTKPYVVTEHGPLGPWEVGTTAWGAPLERSSSEKALLYAKGYRANVVGQSDRCLGTYAFLWGHKQETTATWFGMLLPDGSRLAAADAMTNLWTGHYPANRCPHIQSLTLDRTSNLKPGEQVHAVLQASDPEHDELTFQWILRSDSGTIGEGGDAQQSESAIPNAIEAERDQATLTVPETTGSYRLFAYIYDGNGGAAVANVPLQVAGAP